MIHRFSLRIPAAALALLLLLAAPAAVIPISASPASDGRDMVLPGPKETTFVFRPVPIRGQGPLATSRFFMGDAEGGFRTPLTEAAVGGAFEVPPDKAVNAGEEWAYYMGKYEVTRTQYDAVLGHPRREDGDLPVTDITYFDALQFVDRLNRWLYEHAPEALPRSKSYADSSGYPAYVRLPTEVEWEYAARGGSRVDKLVFDAATPYGETLNRHEWFAASGTPEHKIHPVGTLEPNPLGLYDMLGNVQEMTQSLYQIAYMRGRSGGFVARGGHFLTAEDKLRSSLRSDEPFYLCPPRENCRPNAKPTLGFRLVLAAPLLTDRATITVLEDAWNDNPDTPVPVSGQEAALAREALDRLGRIRNALDRTDLTTQLQADIAATEAALGGMSRIRRQADEDSALAWIRLMSERGMTLMQNLNLLAADKTAPPSPAILGRIEERLYNIQKNLISYGEIMEEMAKLPGDVILWAFEMRADELVLKARDAEKEGGPYAEKTIRDLRRQILWLGVTKSHYERYAKDRRAAPDQWRAEYAEESPPADPRRR